MSGLGYERKKIHVKELMVNPENKRYINSAQNEIEAILKMFKVSNGEPIKEMINLAKDIAENGLNPFEQPIVWFDENIRKYLVIEGNRRISCIKLMTVFRENNELLSKLPKSVKKVLKYNYSHGNEVECVIYNDFDEANSILPKIHQDVNEGIGRKQWGPLEKEKDKAERGEKSKHYALFECIINNPLTTPRLIERMSNEQWFSKLERVVSYATFKEYYSVDWDENNNLETYYGNEIVVKMFSKLFEDLMDLTSKQIDRKEEFDKYYQSLPDEYKSDAYLKKIRTDNKQIFYINTDVGKNKEKNKMVDSKKNGLVVEKVDDLDFLEPVNYRKNENKLQPMALSLSKLYDEKDFNCLNEKGKDILTELLSLNLYQYPYACAVLCRSIIEYTARK